MPMKSYIGNFLNWGIINSSKIGLKNIAVLVRVYLYIHLTFPELYSDKVEIFRVGTCCTLKKFLHFKGWSNQFTATANWQLLQKWSMVEMPYLIIFSFIIRCKCKYLTDWVMCQDGTCFLWVLHLFVCFFVMKLFQVRISALQSLLQKWSAMEFDC